MSVTDGPALVETSCENRFMDHEMNDMLKLGVFVACREGLLSYGVTIPPVDVPKMCLTQTGNTVICFRISNTCDRIAQWSIIRWFPCNVALKRMVQHLC